MTDTEKLDKLLGMVAALTDEVLALKTHVMHETNDHDRRLRRIELQVLDTERPAASNGGGE